MHPREDEFESLRQVLYGGTIAFLVLAGFVIFFLVMYMRRKQRNILEKQQLQSQFQQELLQTQLEIQEQTLKTISEEIHDNIGQALSLAKLKLNTVDISKQEQLIEKITDSKNLVSKAIQDLRDLSRSLNTDNIAAMGLIRAVEYELELFRKSGFATDLRIIGTITRMEPQRELIIFRIVQEALTNIIKHAEARSINVTAAYNADTLELQVQDDGKGTTVMQDINGEENSNKSLGLRNMHNRAKMVGAAFSMESVPGNGTVIKLSIPFNKV